MVYKWENYQKSDWCVFAWLRTFQACLFFSHLASARIFSVMVFMQTLVGVVLQLCFQGCRGHKRNRIKALLENQEMGFRSIFESSRAYQVIRAVIFTFCLWQLEVCLIFRSVGWQTDILFMKLPNWFVVTFYSMVLAAVFLWSEISKMGKPEVSRSDG